MRFNLGSGVCSASDRQSELARVAGRKPSVWPLGSWPWMMESSAESVSPGRDRAFRRETPARAPLLEFLRERETQLGLRSHVRGQQGRYLAMARLKSRMKSG